MFFGGSHGIEILVSQPGIKPIPHAREVQNLNHWTAKEIPCFVNEVIKKYLLKIYFWLHWVFIALGLFPNCRQRGLPSGCSAQASHCRGFSGGAQALGGWASVVACTRLAALPPVKSSWTKDRTRVPALAGRFLPTEPPRKPNEITSGKHLRMGASCQGNQPHD